MFTIFTTGAIQTRISQKTGQLQTPEWPGHYAWAELQPWAGRGGVVGTWHSLHSLRLSLAVPCGTDPAPHQVLLDLP